ncbi:hypothetical protein D3C77_606650 [compost metagenome]
MKTCTQLNGLKCLEVAIRKVYNMHIVTHPSAVAGRVIVAKYFQLSKLANSHLAKVGHEIIGNTQRVLTNQPASVCTDRIKVTNSGDTPSTVGLGHIRQYLLDHQF